ncbi:MAG: hypothetical protein ACI8U3_001422 [Brevundimonas sp.]|jgi:hypothetical protein|uniref:hypothetical protein n=1 Tax=Brevundimonas sp. TaxID=1871086 RepID=UPI0039E30593
MRRLIAPVAALAMLAACQQAEEPAPPTAEAPATPAPTQPAPEPATGTPAAEPVSCEAELGLEAAQALVERCVRVSPATRPPCNVANPCAMIQGEIDRSCALWEDDDNVPAECTA